MIWVLKKYKNVVLETIAQTNQSVEQHARKVVKMHCLAQNFACQLAAQVTEKGIQREFCDTIAYGNIFLGRKQEIFFNIDEFVLGLFQAFVNNDSSLCSNVGALL